MRVFALFGAAAVMIGGCGSKQAHEEPEADRAASAPASPAPAPAGDQSAATAPPGDQSAATAPPKAPAAADAPRETVIPAAFVGVYDNRLANCSRPSLERTTITPGELRFHESVGKVRSVLLRKPNELEVEADYQGEGEFWRSNQLLTLSPDGARLTIDGNGTHLARVRCPAGAG